MLLDTCTCPLLSFCADLSPASIPTSESGKLPNLGDVDRVAGAPASLCGRLSGPALPQLWEQHRHRHRRGCARLREESHLCCIALGEAIGHKLIYWCRCTVATVANRRGQSESFFVTFRKCCFQSQQSLCRARSLHKISCTCTVLVKTLVPSNNMACPKLGQTLYGSSLTLQGWPRRQIGHAFNFYKDTLSVLHHKAPLWRSPYLNDLNDSLHI